MDLEESKEVQLDVTSSVGDEKRSQKKDLSRFEFALLVNDFLICRRSFQINGYIEGSMKTLEFKKAIDEIVGFINDDLVSKSRVWTWYHHWPEKPEVEPEMVEPLIDEWTNVFKFVVYENGVEVISRIWDGRYYPSYVRKNVDITNRQVKIIKDERVTTYDKDVFFAANDGQVSGELYVLKCMIMDKENLIPKIQKCIYRVCSSNEELHESSSDCNNVVNYGNTIVKKDEDGKFEIVKDENKCDAFGKPWINYSLERPKIKSKKYNLNIEQYNKNFFSSWGSSVADKTRKYMRELYVSPKEKYIKKTVNN